LVNPSIGQVKAAVAEHARTSPPGPRRRGERVDGHAGAVGDSRHGGADPGCQS
jgi:hypothetical protein